MAITVEERFRSRSSDASGRTRQYVVTDSAGDLTEQAGENAVLASVPEELDDFFQTNIALTESLSNGLAIYTVTWGNLSGGGGTPGPVVGSVEYEFSYQAESVHITQSLATRKYGLPAPEPPAPDNKGAIGVRYVDGEIVVDGLDTPAGGTTNVWSFTTTTTTLTTTYEALVEGMMGRVNSQTFAQRPAGTMRFVACTSQLTSGNRLNIRYGFQFRPNRGSSSNPVVIAGISVDGIGGHELLDGIYATKPDANGVLAPYLRWLYVHQVFEFADFNQLGF